MPKRKRNREPQSENTPIPERFISSHKPDPTLEWCAKCQSHTKQGQRTRKVHSNDGPTRTRQVVCCDYCKAHLGWDKPVDVQKAVKHMLLCIAVIGVIMAIDFAVFSLWDGSGGLMTSLCLSVAILPFVVAMLIWLLYLRWQWRNWLSQQPQNVDEWGRGHIHRQHEASPRNTQHSPKCLRSFPHHQ